jgi:hypothetical protein
MYGVSRTILGTAESDTNRACYDSETEVLTEHGWKKYLDVKWGEKIAEYDPATHTIRAVEPLGSYCYKYTGKMAKFENEQTDILVTPDHRMWFRPESETEYRIGYAEDVPNNARFETAVEDPWQAAPVFAQVPVNAPEFVDYPNRRRGAISGVHVEKLRVDPGKWQPLE